MGLIYLLSDPDGRPRYVGYTTKSLRARLKQHRSDARRGLVRPVCRWLRRLLEEGGRPLVTILEDGADYDREVHWIAHYRAMGAMLNLCDGGLGGVGFHHTPETIARLRGPKTTAHRDNAASALAKVRASGEYRAAKGDENGSRRHPERVPRGEKHSQSKLTEQDVVTLRRRFREGESTLQLAADYKITPISARRAAQGKTWKHLPGAGEPRGQGRCPTKDNRAGERSPHAKLTICDVLEIRRSAHELSYAELGRRFNVSPDNISRIVRRQSWKRVA